jgi:hypothetical protein
MTRAGLLAAAILIITMSTQAQNQNGTTATLIVATIMIEAAAHANARKLTPDVTIGQVMFTLA